MDKPIFQNLNVLEEQTDHELKELTLTCSFSHDDSVFQGHFPDQPILAGAYQLSLATHYFHKLLGIDLAIRKIKKARFKGLILPNESFTLKLKVLSELPDQMYKVSVKVIKEEITITNITLILRKK
ncbi:MAG: hypothetical protein IEMM0008_1341 [bacterium]|nr:MAG: hypothetical protein IEMM0008_1341 [bacterium]